MKTAIRLGVVLGLTLLISACKTTTSSVSTHTDLKSRSVVAYASGLETKPVKGNRKGFQVAHSKVQLSCLKPGLVKLLRKVEKHYGKSVVVTSGYRSASYNRRVRGAKNSQHIQCKAADIRVPGVSKQALAKYAKSLSGIGGVGIYCRSSYVHLDIGKRRDWYWGCGKRRRS